MTTYNQGSASSWWNQPMPQGWEAKYDPEQRRYFYIDHINRVTAWEDPRKTIHQTRVQQPAAHAGQHHQQYAGGYGQHGGGQTAYGHHGSGQPAYGLTPGAVIQPVISGRTPPSGRHPSPQPGRSPRPSPRPSPQPVRSHSPQPGYTPQAMAGQHPSRSPQPAARAPQPSTSNTEEHIPMADLSSQQRRPSWQKQETVFSGVDEVKVDRLKELFPTTSKTAIRGALNKYQSGDSLALAIADLQSQGYRRVSGDGVDENSPMVKRLQAEFPSAKGLISDVIVSVGHDESRARQQLIALGYRSHADNQHRGVSPQRSASPQRAASPARVASPVRPKLSEMEKTAMRDRLQSQFIDQAHSVVEMALEACEYDESRAKGLLASMATTTSSRAKSPAKSPTRKTSTPERRSVTPDRKPSSTLTTTASNSSPSTSTTSLPGPSISSLATPKTSATKTHTKTVTIVTPSSPRHGDRRSNTPTRRLAADARPVYKSANTSKPDGQDKDLPDGPQKKHLMDSYLPQLGPDPNLAKGPDESLHAGPGYLADGADPSLRHGRDRSLRAGPNPALLSSSCTAQASQERGGVCNSLAQALCYSGVSTAL